MALTLQEVSVGIADKVNQKVIDNFRRGSYLLDHLTFDDAVSPGTGGSTLAYGYLQLQTPSTADFRDINNEYTSNEAKRAKKIAYLKIFGGSAQIDRVLQKASATNEIEFQLQQKTKAASNLFNYCAINGSKTKNTKEFDGLNQLLKGMSTEYNAGGDATAIDLSDSSKIDTNYKSMLDMMLEFMSGMQGKPHAFLANSKLIAKLKSVAYRAGYLTKSEDAFGRTVQGFDGVPFIDLEDYYTSTGTQPTVAIDKEKGTTDLYAVQFGLDAFHGISIAGDNIINTYLPDLTAPGAVKKAEVEMVSAVCLKDTTKAGVFRGIKVQPATTQVNDNE